MICFLQNRKYMKDHEVIYLYTCIAFPVDSATCWTKPSFSNATPAFVSTSALAWAVHNPKPSNPQVFQGLPRASKSPAIFEAPKFQCLRLLWLAFEGVSLSSRVRNPELTKPDTSVKDKQKLSEAGNKIVKVKTKKIKKVIQMLLKQQISNLSAACVSNLHWCHHRCPKPWRQRWRHPMALQPWVLPQLLSGTWRSRHFRKKIKHVSKHDSSIQKVTALQIVRNTVNLGAQKSPVEALSGSFIFGFGHPNLEAPFHISGKVSPSSAWMPSKLGQLQEFEVTSNRIMHFFLYCKCCAWRLLPLFFCYLLVDVLLHRKSAANNEAIVWSSLAQSIRA